MSSGLSDSNMKEFDDTPIPESETVDDILTVLIALRQRLGALEAKVEDLHASDAARRLNMATSDPEWY